MSKRAIVRWFVGFSHEWNEEFHAEIEQRIRDEYVRVFPDGIRGEAERTATVEKMRAFYYQRMTTSASLLLSGATLIVSLVVLFVSLIALYK